MQSTSQATYKCIESYQLDFRVDFTFVNMAYSMMYYGYYAVTLLLVTLVLLISGLVVQIHLVRQRYGHIPSPKISNFFLGHAQDFVSYGSFPKLLEKWRHEYGPIFVIYVLQRVVVVVSDANTIKELLTRSKYHKSPKQYRPFNAVFGVRSLGQGLVSVTDHEAWSKRRALINPAFHRKYLMGLMDQFNSSSDQLISHLTQFADGRTEVKMLDEFGRITLDVIARVGFGITEDFITNPNGALCRLVPHVCEAMNNMYKYPLLEWSPLPSHLRYKKEARQFVRQLRDIGRRCIVGRIAAMERGEEVPKDILTYILEASNNLKEEGFGMEDMIDEFCTFFGAGQETTANLLSFTLLNLGMHPDVMLKLKKEVDSLLEGKSFVEYSDVSKMQYMTLVMKESMRLNPPVFAANRLLPMDMEMCGYKVPKGTVTIMSTYIMSRHEEHFKDPLKFDPERFTRDEDSPLFAYFPFSLGARSCIGQTFAMIEAKVILSKLLQTFNFQLVPGQSTDFQEALTMKPKDGCKNFITLR